MKMKMTVHEPLRIRRKFARYKFSMTAEIIWQGKKRWGRVTDISQGGMFIEIPDAPCLDASFTTHLALNVPLRLDCIVCRAIPSRGIGVTFLVSEKGRKRFNALLLALAAGTDPDKSTASRMPLSRTIVFKKQTGKSLR
jgi:hypothetical protein